jgi:hypothetical protein
MGTTLAYLDPGSSGLIIQLIGGGLAAVAVTAKLFWRRILSFLRIRDDAAEDPGPPEPDASEAAADRAPRSAGEDVRAP